MVAAVDCGRRLHKSPVELLEHYQLLRMLHTFCQTSIQMLAVLEQQQIPTTSSGREETVLLE
jgi:hypothetical protein